MKKLFTYLLALVATISISANAATYDEFLAAIKSAEFEYSESSPNGVFYYLTMNDGHTLTIDGYYIVDENYNSVNDESDITGNGTDCVTIFISMADDPESDEAGLDFSVVTVSLDDEEVEWNYDDYLWFTRKATEEQGGSEGGQEEQADPIEDFKAAITSATYTVDEETPSFTCTLVIDANTSFELGDNSLLVSPFGDGTEGVVSVDGNVITILFEYAALLPEGGENVTIEDLRLYKVNGNRTTGTGYVTITFVPDVHSAVTVTDAEHKTLKLLRDGRILLRQGDNTYDVLGR